MVNKKGEEDGICLFDASFHTFHPPEAQQPHNYKAPSDITISSSLIFIPHPDSLYTLHIGTLGSQ